MKPPSAYNLPHTEWRKYQGETVEWILGTNRKVNIVAAPTGAGKTGVAAALGSQGRTVAAVTPRLSLQEQYEEYGFKSLFGRGNYQCDFNPIFTAKNCQFLDMYKCPVSDKCKYLEARHNYIDGDRGSINYHYYLGAREWLKSFQKEWTVLDEAHNIRSMLLDHLTLDITPRDCEDLEIPYFPTRNYGANSLRLKIIKDWLHKALFNIEQALERFIRLAKGGSSNLVHQVNFLRQQHTQFNNVYEGIRDEPERWFSWIEQDRLRVAPLSVEGYFEEFFTGGDHGKFLLMSATIGNIDSFTKALGIERYAYRAVPSRFKAEERPVYVHPEAPRMSYGASPLAKRKQASIIKEMITTVPESWSGIIHCNSKKKTRELAENLVRAGINNDRVYVIEGKGTNGKLRNWDKYKKKQPNALGLSWSMGEGVDLGSERINILANTPFASLGDPIVRARAHSDGDAYKYEAALSLEQQAGRTRRGVADRDYDLELEVKGLVAIADANYSMVMPHFSEDFVSTLTPW